MAGCLSLLLSTLEELKLKELKKFRLYLSEGTPEGFARMPRGKLQEDSDATDIASQMTGMYGSENSLKITLLILREMKHNEIAARLEGELERTQTNAQGLLCQLSSRSDEPHKHENLIKQASERNKGRLRRKFERLFEGREENENQRYLHKIYTELYIVDAETEKVKSQHEVWHIEMQSRTQTSKESIIKCNDIFHCSPGQRQLRTVITTGVAGIGKTVSVHKFILDWAEGRANQDIDLIFVLPFRELNLVLHDQYSLLKLLLDFHPELTDVDDRVLYESKIVFIFDGLDESKLPLNFVDNKNFSNVKEATSVDMLITNLIRETLLSSAYIWITSRPAAASQIPSEYIDRWTEIKGFDNQQKEVYFKNKIKNQVEADQVIRQIKQSRILYVMCHIPVFCWILTTVLQKILSQGNDRTIPQTLTEIFIHFLVIQMNRKKQKYERSEKDQKKLWESNKDAVLKYAELGFKQLDKGNILFTEEDLTDCGIDFNEDLEKAGICTEIFVEDILMQKKKVFCFVHLSVQEFLAAIFVLHSFASKNLKTLQDHNIYGKKLHHILASAVDKSLQFQNGQFDLFVRFLLGISMESNQKLLQRLQIQTESNSEGISTTIRLIKAKISSGVYSAERCVNLLLCLLEMKDNSLEREIQQYVTSGATLSPEQCSVLAYMLLMSENIQEEFDLGKYNTTNVGRNRLIVALGVYRKARLVCCDLTKESCEVIKSVTHAENSPLRELDLSGNWLKKDVVQLLCEGLTHKNCKLEALRLAGCDFSYISCKSLASVLRSQHSHLTELDLSSNYDLKDTGVNYLSIALIHSNCRLEKLGLAYCELTYCTCRILASVLTSANSRLRYLDLTNNDLWDCGVKMLSSGMSHLNCKLETLRLSGCLVSKLGCEHLASVLWSNPSHLKELDLSYNHLGDSGVKELSRLLEGNVCKLEKLSVDHDGKHMLKAGLRKYACKLTFNQNTAHPHLSFSKENQKVMRSREKCSYPEHPERFEEFVQVLCSEGLTGRCYWEVDLTGIVSIGVVYKSISRKGDDSKLGHNNVSWKQKFQTLHLGKKHTSLSSLLSSYSRVGVYLDWKAGMLSFFTINGHDLRHEQTFYAEFTEPLCPAFELLYHDIQESSVILL